MATYPLGPLLRTRKFREDAAAREVAKAFGAVRAAKERLEAAREEWRRYREWRPGEEVRLFELLRGKVLPQSSLDRHREDIEALRNGELSREEACALAEAEVKKAEAEAAKAQAAHADAVRDRRKIEEHRERWRAEEAKRVEAAEEAELEDFHFGGAAADDFDET